VGGLFGFLVRSPRAPSWLDRRFASMRAAMTAAPGHRDVSMGSVFARVGLSGPGILPGNLDIHGTSSQHRMLAEGECYHEDDLLVPGERPGGPWSMVRARWLSDGATAVGRIDGLFTLALLDPSGTRLRLVNDRYGSRRLYLLDTPEAFVFASELGPLLVWPQAGAIDEAFVRQVVCFGAVLDDRTWIRGVRLMPPATEFDATPEGAREERYWRWEGDGEGAGGAERAVGAGSAGAGGARGAEGARGATNGLPPRVADDLVAVWRRALKARLKGERIGQHLSGGLDSRLILADASSERRDWVAVTYGEPRSDEVRFARQAAEAVGVSWHLHALPEPDWLEARTRFCLAHDGVVDIVNAFQATALDRLGSLMSWDVNGYLGDLVMGATYEIATVDEAMACLPYWHSPIAIPESAARRLIAASVGSGAPRGWLVDTKCRRATNAWPHAAVDVMEVRKPFVDHALVAFCAGVPRVYRERRDLHRALLARHPRLARVPWQKTGVPVGAPAARWWAMRARRAAYRSVRSLASRAGLEVAPWVRGAVDLGPWLADATVTEALRSTLLAPGAAVAAYFPASAIAETLRDTLDRRTIAHEPLLHLYLAERMLRHLPERRARAQASKPA
jgi:asparagine synthase (glutamine-hydrolysing)